MAMPLIASPQGIVAIVVIISRAQDLADRIMIVLAVLVTMAINVAVFWGFASAAGKSDAAKKPSVAGEVILRVVSIMLAGLAVQLMILGLRDLGVLPPPRRTAEARASLVVGPPPHGSLRHARRLT